MHNNRPRGGCHNNVFDCLHNNGFDCTTYNGFDRNPRAVVTTTALGFLNRVDPLDSVCNYYLTIILYIRVSVMELIAGARFVT